MACVKCGVNPRTEKNFCNACGTGTNANQIVCLSCGISLKGSLASGNNFPIPLAAGYIVNVVAWMIFILTDYYHVELMMGVFCLGGAYVGYAHHKLHSAPAFDNQNFTAQYLFIFPCLMRYG